MKGWLIRVSKGVGGKGGEFRTTKGDEMVVKQSGWCSGVPFRSANPNGSI